MRIVIMFLVFLMLMIIISLTPRFLNKQCDNIKDDIGLESSTWIEKGWLHVMFAGQFSLLILVMLISFYWFITGKEILVGYTWFWDIVEKGTLEAILSVMGVIGVSSIIIGWVYSERDKVTLGKSLSDIIKYRFGPGYASSVIMHFSATALCMLMAKCNAREVALGAFLTVIWGCIPQARICVYIALNRTNREEFALKLWKQESSENKEKRIETIFQMVEVLNDANVRYHKRYGEVLAEIIGAWLSDFRSDENDEELYAKGILLISTNFWKISEKIPEMEHLTYEGEILGRICSQLQIGIEGKRDVYLLCCGYIRYLYAQSDGKIDDMANDVNRLFYYVQADNVQYKCFEKSTKEILYGLEWFMFLEQYSRLPIHIVGTDTMIENNEYIEQVFKQLIRSIFEGERSECISLARIAWSQVVQQED